MQAINRQCQEAVMGKNSFAFGRIVLILVNWFFPMCCISFYPLCRMPVNWVLDYWLINLNPPPFVLDPFTSWFTRHKKTSIKKSANYILL